MMARYTRPAALGLAASIALAGAAFAQKAYGPGVTDTEIKFGNTMPYSGPASSLGTVGKIMQSYFDMINEKGGVNGRKLNMISLDDGFAPPKTVEAVKRLVESDQVAFVYATMGTAPSSAVSKYLNINKTPHVFLISSAAKWNDPKNQPWSIALPWAPNYPTEAGIDVRYALEKNPNAKFAVLYQNDDSGKEYLRGVREALGANADKAIAMASSFEVTEPTIDSQMISLAATKADVLMIYSVTPRACSQAIRKAWELGWRPIRFISSGCNNVETIFKPAGVEASTGIMTLASLKPLDPESSDPGLKSYIEFIRTRVPGVDVNNSYGIYAYTIAGALVALLEQCKDDLTRENIIRQAANLKGVSLPLLMPGITLNTAPDDYQAIKDGYMMQFNGQKFVPISDLLKAK
jgi:ABC-type branched-subunit amino acid transport system substrate-binding protein